MQRDFHTRFAQVAKNAKVSAAKTPQPWVELEINIFRIGAM